MCFHGCGGNHGSEKKGCGKRTQHAVGKAGPAAIANQHILAVFPVLHFGIADMFTYIGLLEFFYSEAPKGLKSISTCFLWSSMALGYFFSTILVKIVNNATKGNTKSGGWLAGNNINLNHLNLFYWLLSLMSLINFFIYVFVTKRYKYRPGSPMLVSKENKKEIEINEL